MARVVRLTQAALRGDIMSWTALVSNGGEIKHRRVHFYAQDWEYLVSRESLQVAHDRLQKAVERRVMSSPETSFRVDLADLEA